MIDLCKILLRSDLKLAVEIVQCVKTVISKCKLRLSLPGWNERSESRSVSDGCIHGLSGLTCTSHAKIHSDDQVRLFVLHFHVLLARQWLAMARSSSM